MIEFASSPPLGTGCRDIAQGETVSDGHRALQPRSRAREESEAEQTDITRLRTDPSEGKHTENKSYEKTISLLL